MSVIKLALVAMLACCPVMATAAERPYDFPVGLEDFHDDPVYNFQLNRFHSFGFIGHDPLAEAAMAIDSFESWSVEMLRQAEVADAEGRVMEAAYFYRAAEFFTAHDDPAKAELYAASAERFDQAFAHLGFERGEVPYGGGALPTLRLAAQGESKGTLVIHGGFDSFAEEFASGMIYFSERGYDVLVFEGPGQGGARRQHGLVLDPAWERPTSAVLDHYGLEDVTLMGVSMGGYLCLRAAAHEPRIKRVIAWSIAYDYPRFPGPVGQLVARLFLTRWRDTTNRLNLQKIEAGGQDAFFLDNMMYLTGAPTPVEAIDVTWSMDRHFLGSEAITQDVLILTGRHDHAVPHKMHRRQVRALKNASSVTARVFTAKEHGDQHCQIGNIGLAMDTMADWLEALP